MSSLLDVRFMDGFYYVEVEAGNFRPIQNGNRHVDKFAAGWVPVCISRKFSPVFLLLLRHEDGSLAPWYLDAEMNRVGGTVAEIPADLRSSLLAQAADLFQEIVGSGTLSHAGNDTRAVADLAVFGEQTLGSLAHSAAVAANPRVNILKRVDFTLNPFDGPVRAEVPYLEDAFEGRLQHDFLQLMREKEFRRLSPMTGSSCVARIGLILTPRLTAYQFLDEKENALFYVVPDHYFERVVAIYIPHRRIYTVDEGAPEFAEFFWRLCAHIVDNSEAITRFITADSPKVPINFVSDYPWLHIGHVLWNELSGLEELTCLVERELLPYVCVVNPSAGSEVYGPIDVLFPEFNDRLLRWSVNWSDVAGKVYEGRFLYFRYMTKFVWSRVSIRILQLVHNDSSLLDDRMTARRLVEERRPSVCLGLRCGNRTIPDQSQFLIFAIEHLILRLGKVTIVIDGTNSRINSDPTTLYGAFGPASSEDNLISEIKIVFEVRRHFERNTNVRIISTVGRSMGASIFWVNECCFFIAPWGAALTKYRWLCNKPGFVMTNRPILANPTKDITIYNHSDFMESPTEMTFIALDKVADAPGPGGFYANFSPDPDAVKNGINKLIQDLDLIISV